jgi:hypothetical protein
LNAWVGDVTRLPELRFPARGFALDMGCLHGLSPEQQGRCAAGLAAQLAPGGRFMLYAADPLSEGVVRLARGASAWYWMSLKH